MDEAPREVAAAKIPAKLVLDIPRKRPVVRLARVPKELMASRDAIARLEDRLAALDADASADAIGRAVDEAFTTRGAVLFGVRSLASIRDVVLAAL